ncbi:tigger transposable element-derived protein 6-like [Sitodiplosis mosellana]|uniref:tigger transposable element-derived protein 6-like n=1 Tax=Sitodiplosis mosellana TaxID=263140 RepID=UPI00244531A6|nr:tigger transposable element-derived protein 6-like [Sitodiplosis mosellana]
MEEDDPIEKSGESTRKKENKRNQFLSLKTKLDILNKLNDGVRPIRIASEYGIALSTISRLKKCKTSLEEAMSMYQNNLSRRSLRGTFHPKMESALHKWYVEQGDKGIPVTGSILRLKARELNKNIHENDLEFRASPGWMEKFKKRYGIRLKNCRGERNTTDNIAFNYDDNDDANEAKPDVEVKTEDVLYEPAFVTVSNLEDEPLILEKNESNNKGKNYSKVMNCVDEVIQWSVDNDIEPLYLTMLKSLRERIRYQART